MFGIIIVDEWWRVIIRLSPELYLLLAVYLGCLFLAESLECTIVSFVESPRLENLTLVGETHLLKYDIIGLGCPAQKGSVRDIEVVTHILKLSTSLDSFFLSYLVEGNVNPATELAGFIPYGLTVPHEDNFVVALLAIIHNVRWIIRAFTDLSFFSGDP
jgi:hypothetical protein